MQLDKPTLICMDLQKEFVAIGRPWADPDGSRTASICSQIIKKARKHCWTIVHIHLHQGSPLLTAQGYNKPIEECEPRSDEVLLRRGGISAYTHPEMESVMQGGFISQAYLIGFSATTTINTTLFDAEDRHHTLSIIEDGVGSAHIGEWGPEHTKALCIDTARKMDRSVCLKDIPIMSCIKETKIANVI